LAPAARGGIPVETRIPASERTSQKLNELLTHGVADGDNDPPGFDRAVLPGIDRKIVAFFHTHLLP